MLLIPDNVPNSPASRIISGTRRRGQKDVCASANVIEWVKEVEKIFTPNSIEIQCEDKECFAGSAQQFRFGRIQLAVIDSTPVTIRKCEKLVKPNDIITIYIPQRHTVFLDGNGHLNHCDPGEFIWELGRCLETLRYKQPNQILIVNIPMEFVRDRTHTMFCEGIPQVIRNSATVGMMLDFIQSCIRKRQSITAKTSVRLSDQIIDLLSIILDDAEGENLNTDSTAKKAHLQRIFGYIQLNLRDGDLSPQKISEACGISIRYLHLLFKETDWSVSGWIKECRLRETYKVLSDPRKPVGSMAELTYRFGFNDQATFNRCFKTRYGQTPRAVRQKAVSNMQEILGLAAVS